MASEESIPTGGAGLGDRPSAFRWVEPVLAAAIVVSSLAVLLWCAFSTLEFGMHADEPRVTDSVRASLETGLLLPGWYNYPSLIYLISLATAAIHLGLSVGIEGLNQLSSVLLVVGSEGVPGALSQIGEILASERYQIVLRGTFSVLTASTVLFVVLSARAAGAGWLASAIGGCAVLSSYQVFYHSRWVAADGLVLLATAATLSATLRADKERAALPLTCAAIAAGLAASAKYTAGAVLILPLLVALSGPGASGRLVRVIVSFAGTFLLITPGAIVDPIRFVRHVRFEMDHYGKLGHGAHTVDPGLAFFERIVDFLAFRLVSQSPVLSLVAFVAALVGIAVAWRRSPRLAVLLIAAPAVYIGYFMTNRVLFVRNLLFLLPFIAVLMAIGVDLAATAISSRTRRVVFQVAAAAMVLALNWPPMLQARSSFREVERSTWPQSISAYVAARPDRRFAVSPGVAAILADRAEGIPNKIVPIGQADAYLYILHEHDAKYTTAALAKATNRRSIYTVVAGPNDVDLDYYPTWDGKERVVAVDVATARLLTGM